MKIIIAGAGEVGTHLAKMLSNEFHDIINLEHDHPYVVSLQSMHQPV